METVSTVVAEGGEAFFPLVQNHASNMLSRKITERKVQTDPISGDGKTLDKDFRLFVEGYSTLVSGGIKQSAAMLLDCLMIAATRDGLHDTLVELPLLEYMAWRGLSDKKSARQQIEADIYALEHIRFEYRGTGKQRGAWFKMGIAGGTVGQIKNGDIIFRFNQDFFNSFKVGTQNQWMYFPQEALRGSIKAHPWKYFLGRKISEHRRMNTGKPNEDIISVKTLINACPNFPKYEDVNHVTQQIIKPFERDMDGLSPTLHWNYQEDKPQNYKEFMAANIAIQWMDYPDISKIETSRKKWVQKRGGSRAYLRG